MAKALVPQYVASTLTADRTAQINTIATVAVYVFERAKAEQPVEKLADLLFAQAPHRSLATWRAYATACNALVAHAATVTRLESIWAGSAGPEQAAVTFSAWLAKTLEAKGHHCSPEDVTNYAKNRLSIKAQAKADKEAMRAKELADAEAGRIAALAEANRAAEAAANGAPVAAAPVADATPVADAAPVAVVDTAEPAAPALPMVFSVRRAGDALDIEVGASCTVDDMRAIMETLQSLIDQEVAETVAA